LPLVVDNGLLHIRLQARVKKDILYPRIYAQIRDYRGYIIYGIHTLSHELHRADEHDYIGLTATLSVRAMLAPGEYSVTVSLNNAPGEMTQIILDKQVAVATFTVLRNIEKRAFNGVVNLNAIWYPGKNSERAGEAITGGIITDIVGGRDLVVGCVAENTPKYLAQALRLVQSIRWFGGRMAGAKFIVCVVDGIDPAYGDEFQKYSAEVRVVERFSEKHPQSNKLRFLEQEDLQNYKYVLLLDCDTIVVQDPSSFLHCSGLRAKIADAPTISSELFEKIFDFFQLPLPATNFKCTVTGTPTIPYFNAGVLLFSSRAMSDLVPVWINLNKILIENIDILEDSSNYCEQASLSLALAATAVPFEPFDDDMNFPTHFDNFENSALSINTDPLIIHYHLCFDSEGYINHSNYPLVDARIDLFNQRLGK
jgi:hypothetical protein